jgi:hypothetical protein
MQRRLPFQQCHQWTPSLEQNTSQLNHLEWCASGPTFQRLVFAGNILQVKVGLCQFQLELINLGLVLRSGLLLFRSPKALASGTMRRCRTLSFQLLFLSRRLGGLGIILDLLSKQTLLFLGGTWLGGHGNCWGVFV